MPEQTNSSKQIKQHILPANIRKAFEEELQEKELGSITSVRYCGCLVTQGRVEDVKVPTFVVNETYYVYVHDVEEGWYRYETIEQRQKKQNRFGSFVHQLMEQYGFTWELSKVIMRNYSINSDFCNNLCTSIQAAKRYISHRNISTKRATEIMHLFDINAYLDTNNRYVYRVLKDYLFATN